MKDLATYSYSEIRSCVDMLKSTTWTVGRKAEHFGKCFEVKKVFEFCYDKTQCLLFDPDFSPWHDYLQAVDRKDTKKVLDLKLHLCKRFLTGQLHSIYNMMQANEVNSID